VTDTKAVRGVAGAQIHTDLEDAPAFVYKVSPLPCRAPTFAVGRVTGEVYFRTEVHLAEGTQGYDVNGYSRDQLMGDVLDQYERHLSYLHLVQQEQLHAEVPEVPVADVSEADRSDRS
jgi:choline/glycine/proline betaine transport protein